MVPGPFWLRPVPAQALALQPNFAKAYASLVLLHLSQGELAGTRAGIPALFRQNSGSRWTEMIRTVKRTLGPFLRGQPGCLGAASLSHGWPTFRGC